MPAGPLFELETSRGVLSIGMSRTHYFLRHPETDEEVLRPWSIAKDVAAGLVVDVGLDEGEAESVAQAAVARFLRWQRSPVRWPRLVMAHLRGRSTPDPDEG